MSYINTLKSEFEKGISDKALTITRQLTNCNAISNMLEKIPGEILVLNEIEGKALCSLDNEILIISGNPQGSAWQFMGLHNNSVFQGDSFEISITASDVSLTAISSVIIGRLLLPDKSYINAIAEWHSEANLWELYNDERKIDKCDFKSVVELFKSDLFFDEISKFLSIVQGDFQVKDCHIIFTPDGKTQWHTILQLAPACTPEITIIKSPLVKFDNFSIRLENTFSNDTDPESSNLGCMLEGRISLFNWNPVEVSVFLYDPSQMWTLQIKPDCKLPTLADFSNLIDGFDISSFLSPINSDQTEIKISGLEIGFIPADFALKKIKLTLNQSGEWTLVKDFLAVKIDELALTLNYNEKWEPDALLNGSIFLGDAEICIMASLPDLSISGSLDKEKPVIFESLLSYLKLPADILPAEMKNINISEMDFFANGDSKHINFGSYIRINDIMRLDKFPGSDIIVVLDYIAVGIAYDNTAETKINAKVQGGMSVYPHKDKMTEKNRMLFDIGFFMNGKEMFTAEAKNINLSKILECILSIDLPEELPDVVIKDLKFSIDSKRNYQVHGEVTLEENEKQHLKIGDESIQFGSMEFNLIKSSEDLECNIKVKGQNIPAIAGIDAELKNFEFHFNYVKKEKQACWDLGGTIQGRIFDHDNLSLSVSYKDITVKQETKKCFALTYEDKSNKPAISIPDIISIEINKIDFGIERKQSGTQTSTEWHILADGKLDIMDLLDKDKTLLEINGELFLEHTETSTKFKFAPKPGSSKDQGITLSLLLPVFEPGSTEKNPSLDFSFKEIDISFKTTKEKKTEWEFIAASSLTFSGIPSKLEEIIHSGKIEISSDLKLNNNGFDFNLASSIATAEFDYPVITVPIADDLTISSDNKTIVLGKGAIGINNLHFQITKDDINGSIDIKAGLPSELNNLIGKALQSDDFELFNVYNPDPEYLDESTVDLHLSFGLKSGLSVVLATSPFKSISIEDRRSYDSEGNILKRTSKNNADKYIYVELEKAGLIGEIEFEVPKFSIDTTKGALTAKGGFEIRRDIEIPLSLLQNLLKKNNIPLNLPTSIPLKGVQFFDKDGKFNLSLFVKEFKNITGTELPAEIQSLFGFIVDNILDKLPARLKPYLNLSFPKGFHFDIALTPDGGCKVDLKGHGDVMPRNGEKETEPKTEPIRILYPSMSGILPVLNGIEFRSFSFGELLSGSFLLVEADLRFEQFDIFSIIISLLVAGLSEIDPDDLDKLKSGIPEELRKKLSKEQIDIIEKLLAVSSDVFKAFVSVAKSAKSIIASPADLQSTVIIDKLMMLIIYETGIPIPVPLFYDKLGVEITNILGITLQSHIGFPAPKSVNLMEIVQVALNFKDFFTDYNYDLPLTGEGVPKSVDLTFKADNNYIKLPKLLGDKILVGSPGENLNISLYKTVANILNALKKISPDKLIRAIPYEKRAGEMSIVFGPLNIQASYFLSTSDEITSEEYKKDPDFIAIEKKPDINKDYISMSEFAISKFMELSGCKEGNKYSVIYLSGAFGSEKFFNIDSKFGLIVTGSNEFLTGFQFNGKFLDFVELDMKAAAFLIKGSAQGLKSTTFQISGETSLDIAKIKVFSANGLIRIDEETFYAEGKIQSFPKSFPIHADCNGSIMIDKSGDFKLYFDSEAHLKLMGFDLVKSENCLYIYLKDKHLCFHALIDDKIGILNTKLICDFEIAEKSASADAGALIKLGNIKMLDTALKLSVSESDFSFSGIFDLFPDIKATHFKGNISGNISKDKLNISGGLDVTVAGLLLSSCVLNASKEYVYFNADFLGFASQKFEFSNKGNEIILKGSLNLGLFSINTSSSLGKDLATTHFDSSLTNDFKLICDFSSKDINAKGSIVLSLFNISIFSGHIYISSSQYSIDGNILVFPPQSPAKFDIGLGGQLNHEGIKLTGSNDINILNLITLHSDTQIFNGLPGFSIRVNVLGVNYKSSAGLYPYNGNIAFCLSYTIPAVWVFDWFIIVPESNWYLMVTVSGISLTLQPPGGWPASFAKLEDPEEQEIIKLEQSEIPDARQSINDIGHLLKAEINTTGTNCMGSVMLTKMLYHMNINIIQNTDKFERVINIYKTEHLSNLKDNIFNLFINKSGETANIDELELRLTDSLVLITTKSQTIELKQYSITMTDDFYSTFMRQFVEKL